MPDTYLVSRTAADDAAFLALGDLSHVLGGEEESGIIGGLMVSLLCARFPSPGTVARRGWRFLEPPLTGARRDAGRALHLFAQGWEARPPNVPIDYRQVIASIRSRVAYTE